jgi:hypothetical protein
MGVCVSLLRASVFGDVRLFVDVGSLRAFWSQYAYRAVCDLTSNRRGRRSAYLRKNSSAALSLRVAVDGLAVLA